MTKHRGLAPGDDELFSQENLPKLQRAVSDLAWLLSKGYPEVASLKLVGDHFNFIARQRSAIGRHVAPIEAGDDGACAQRLEGTTGFATLCHRKGGLLIGGNVFFTNPLCHSRPSFPRSLVRNPG